MGSLSASACDREDNHGETTAVRRPAVHDGVGLKRNGQDPDRSHERRMDQLRW